MSGGRVVAGSNPVIPTVENQRVMLKSQYGPFLIDKQIDKQGVKSGQLTPSLRITQKGIIFAAGQIRQWGKSKVAMPCQAKKEKQTHNIQRRKK